MNGFSPFDSESYPQRNVIYYEIREKEKREIKKLSLFAGSAVILYVVIQNGIFLAVELFGLLDLYKSNALFGAGTDILLTILGVFLPFALMGAKMKKISGEKEPVLASAPKSFSLLILGALGATGFIMVANILSSYITWFISLFGFELTAPDIEMPEGFFGFFVSMLRICILTAIVEEYSLRGHILGNLRKYGDMFAVVVSASIFALMHGNLIQVPFAMLSGIALAIFTLKTKSIWPAIIAHAINNGLSVVITYLIRIMGEDPAMTLYTIAIYGFIFMGIIASLIFALITKDVPLRKSESALSASEKFKAFLLTPTTLVSLVIMVVITSASVS